MKHIRWTFAALLAASCAAALPGCGGSTRTGAPYTMKADREIEAYLPGNVRHVHDEALWVVRDHFGFKLIREAVDLREGYIEARTAQDNVVRIETYKSGETITRIEVFVGPLGDEPAMKDILAEIDLRVNSRPNITPTPSS